VIEYSDKVFRQLEPLDLESIFPSEEVTDQQWAENENKKHWRVDQDNLWPDINILPPQIRSMEPVIWLVICATIYLFSVAYQQ
jgi:hypothetical protein